jgi:hypothetical protein
VWYSPNIAIDWLAAQYVAVKAVICSYGRGGGADALSEPSLALFAESLAL